MTLTSTIGAARAVARIQADDNHVRSLRAADAILVGLGQPVGRIAEQRVGAAEDDVDAGCVQDHVVAAAADQTIVVDASVEPVVAGVADEDIDLHALVGEDVVLREVDGRRLVREVGTPRLQPRQISLQLADHRIGRVRRDQLADAEPSASPIWASMAASSLTIAISRFSRPT